jgi:hypothetical protein
MAMLSEGVTLGENEPIALLPHKWNIFIIDRRPKKCLGMNPAKVINPFKKLENI